MVGYKTPAYEYLYELSVGSEFPPMVHGDVKIRIHTKTRSHKEKSFTFFKNLCVFVASCDTIHATYPRFKIMNTKYKLAKGSQVRGEDFGLLFYRMNGPRLYFISSGDLLTPEFFEGVMTLDEWMIHSSRNKAGDAKISELEKTLSQLSEKGVIVEC